MDEQGQNQPHVDDPPQQAEPAPEQSEADKPEWQYQSGDLTPPASFSAPGSGQADLLKKNDAAGDSISWSASEFVHHEKSGGWYVYLVVGAIVLAAGIYFITKEIFSVVAIAIMAVAFGVFGAMKPKVLEYSISPDGIQVGHKSFSFEEFRSFAVIEEGALPSIQLLPHKRLAVAITMYFEPKDGDKIVGILGEYLPFEHRERDMMDKFASKIHF